MPVEPLFIAQPFVIVHLYNTRLPDDSIINFNLPSSEPIHSSIDKFCPVDKNGALSFPLTAIQAGFESFCCPFVIAHHNAPPPS